MNGTKQRLDPLEPNGPRKTRLQEFMDRERISSGRLEKASGIRRQSMREIRTGRDIKLSTARRILHALRKLTGRKVAIEEIFDFDADDTAA